MLWLLEKSRKVVILALVTVFLKVKMAFFRYNLRYKPTAKWVFELFVDVHLLFITTDNDVEVLTMNLKSELKSLLALLGPNYPRIYFKNS